ncbi:MAG: sigma-70 family RNA polymerase sigma factor [Acidimicrobiales bacterium]|nr:sigma-70 family RNA polymerase sigma factor [Acidimicrobiales bacterium]
MTGGRRGWSDTVVRSRLIAGDESALADVIARHGPLVRGVARRVLADPDAAADAAQDVFVWLWSHPDRFDPERGSLPAFLAVTARRRAIDRLRREGAHQRALHRAAEALDPRPPPLAGDPAELVGAGDEGAQLRRAVAALPEDQRRAVELAYFGGCTYREVAQRLGIPEGTAKSRLRLGLARLADALRTEGLAP